MGERGVARNECGKSWVRKGRRDVGVLMEGYRGKRDGGVLPGDSCSENRVGSWT